MDNGFQLLGVDGATSSKRMKISALAAASIASVMFVSAFFSGGLGNRSSSEATELLGFFGATHPQLRSAGASADQLLRYGIKPSPLSQLAIAAIEMNSRANQNRDVSMRALEEAQDKVVQEVEKLDYINKQKLEETSKAVEMKARDMVGITAPTGFFDPIALSVGEEPGKLLFYRECELKHGRVAMLASLGILVGEQFHPLFGGNIDVPSYIAFQQTPLQTFWPAVVAAVAIPEIFSVFTFADPWEPTRDQMWQMPPDRVPGDFNFDPLGLKPTNPEDLKDMQNKELNNGRLAMIAAAGMLAQEIATGGKLF